MAAATKNRQRINCAEQNLYMRAKELFGDRDPRQHEFSVQLRAFDNTKSGAGVGVGVLLALNSVAVVENAVEKGAASILMPISSRRQLNDLPDDLAAKITIHYYLDARDALLKALAI